MEEVEVLLEKIRTNGHEVWVNGATSSDAIVELEKEMKVELPESLRLFLTNYGAIGIYDIFISGIIENNPLDDSAGGIYSDTKYMKEEFADMSDSLWVISKHEDGAYCIDISKSRKNGEYAIVNLEYGNTQNPTVVSQSFSEFLCEWFLKGWANDHA